MFYFCEFNSFGGENAVVRFTEKFYGTSQLLKKRLCFWLWEKKRLKGFIRFSVIELQSFKLKKPYVNQFMIFKSLFTI